MTKRISTQLRLANQEARRAERCEAKLKLKPPDEMVKKAVALGARLIPLTKGRFVMVDLEDYEQLIKFNWAYNKPIHNDFGYAITGIFVDGKRNPCFLHNMITGNKSPLMIDHINRNRLDCRKVNLRKCTNSQNLCNRPAGDPVIDRAGGRLLFMNEPKPDLDDFLRTQMAEAGRMAFKIPRTEGNTQVFIEIGKNMQALEFLAEYARQFKKIYDPK